MSISPSSSLVPSPTLAQADMVLLGGDLFHRNKPSHGSLVRVAEILSGYCYGGDRPSPLQLVSDPWDTFDDGKCNILRRDRPAPTLPVFGIHGNHDDPTGTERRLPAMPYAPLPPLSHRSHAHLSFSSPPALPLLSSPLPSLPYPPPQGTPRCR